VEKQLLKNIIIKKKGQTGRKQPPQSPIDKLLSVPRQRANSLNDPKNQFAEQEHNSSDEEGGEGISEHDTSSEYELDQNGHSDITHISNPILESLTRQRASSVSPQIPRPVLDFEDVITGKVKPAKINPKKRNQTPQKIKRPVLSEEMFKPPEASKKFQEALEQTKPHQLSQVQGGMNLVPENVSLKPLEQIVEEVLRVIQKEDLKHRKRKNKFIWKCSADISNETVQLELEIMNVKNNNYGIMVRRIQGSFPAYQVLYNRIKKELHL